MLDSYNLTTHFWTPSQVLAEVTQFEFRFIYMLGDDYPLKSHPWITGWYYYVFAKKECCRSK